MQKVELINLSFYLKICFPLNDTTEVIRHANLVFIGGGGGGWWWVAGSIPT